MGFFGEILNCRKNTDIRQTVDDYNKWDGAAVIYFDPDRGRYWTDATNRLLARMPREPTAADIAIVSKDFLLQKTKVSITAVKSMTEKMLKNIESNENNKENIEIEV